MFTLRLSARLLFVLALNLLCFVALAQKESNVWYFGKNAGLDFNQTPVKALTDGKYNNIEACASICDNTGKLIMYTDGATVWNFNHEVVNGPPLKGFNSATQTIIVPLPNTTHLYYIFSIDLTVGGIHSLYYSEVDMSKNGGRGQITVDNIKLLNRATEKITAIRHANGRDVWLIAHELNSSDFYAWLITKKGISQQPVITTIGTRHHAFVGLGYMKASIDGTKLALAAMSEVPDDYFVELFEFDRRTGKPASPKKLTNFDYRHSTYGLEFSKDAGYLYISTSTLNSSKIYQIPANFSSGPIAASGAYTLATAVGYGALQMGPDGRIYVARIDKFPDDVKYLDVIENPSAAGAGSGFTSNAVYLDGKISQIGLPNFIQSSLGEVSFTVDGECASQNSTFTMRSRRNDYDEIIWNFGDPESGTANTSSSANPTHVYRKAGEYQVTIVVKKDGNMSDYSQTVTINAIPATNLPAKATLYQGTEVRLNAGGSDNTYLWSTGSTANEIAVSTPGIYSVSITNGVGCTIFAQTEVTVYPLNGNETQNLKIPNTFTPNNDGINDFFTINQLNLYPNVVKIFNRDGNILFLGNNYQNNWDGTYRGSALPAGVYYYMINVGKQSPRAGYITIVR